MSNEINQINSIEEAQAMIASEEEKKQSIYADPCAEESADLSRLRKALWIKSAFLHRLRQESEAGACR